MAKLYNMFHEIFTAWLCSFKGFSKRIVQSLCYQIMGEKKKILSYMTQTENIQALLEIKMS